MSTVCQMSIQLHLNHHAFKENLHVIIPIH
uniref:Uncharacterized protein n=1 Tax=Arundo donax TaxID=35708 RepID=A0A0A8YVI4_ARUDO